MARNPVQAPTGTPVGSTLEGDRPLESIGAVVDMTGAAPTVPIKKRSAAPSATAYPLFQAPVCMKPLLSVTSTNRQVDQNDR